MSSQEPPGATPPPSPAPPVSALPSQGLGHDEALQRLAALRSDDARWAEGRTFSLVYHAGDEHTEFLKRAYALYFSENALNPTAFASLRRCEREVVAMALKLLGGGAESAGTMTSGGSESLFLALKAYRDRARSEGTLDGPAEVIAPRSAHPAIDKAAHSLGLRVVQTPVGPDFRADLAATRAAITPRTILLIGSAPSYPQGVVDPIAELGALALERGLGLHVDACVGGFQLPFLRQLGEPIPPFDLSVPGVTSLSADLHKYGFAAKGASVILYRERALRRHQFFARSDWPGGLFGSTTVQGTRAGGSIAAAWATLMALGQDGYQRMAQHILRIARAFQVGIAAIPGLRVLGQPAMSVFAFAAEALPGEDAPGDREDRSGPAVVDLLAVADHLELRGWHCDRQQHPTALHLMITPAHEAVVDEYLSDLRACVDHVRRHPEEASPGRAAMYGALLRVPDPRLVDDFILHFLDSTY